MKTKIYKLKNIFAVSALLFFVMISSTQLKAQLLLEENFNCTTGATIIGSENTNVCGWVGKTGGTFTNPNNITATIAANNLAWSTYIGSNVGNSITTNYDGAGSSPNVVIGSPSFAAQSGTVYMAFLLRVNESAVGSGKSSAFGIAGLANGQTGSQRARVFIKRGTTASKYRIATTGATTSGLDDGSEGASANIVFTTEEYDINTTYLVVLKNVPGGLSHVYVNPTPGDAEPGSPTISSLDNSTTNAITNIFIRGNGSSSPVNWTISGIRVGTSWTEVVAAAEVGTSTKLSDLKVGGTTIADFNKNTTEYTYFLSRTLNQSPNVTATAEDAENVNVVLNPTSGSQNFSSTEISLPVTVTVTDKVDTDNETVYTVNFVRDTVIPKVVSIKVDGKTYADNMSVGRAGSVAIELSKAIKTNPDCSDPLININSTGINKADVEISDNVLTIDFEAAHWDGTDALAIQVVSAALVDNYNNIMDAAIELNLVFDQTAPVLVSASPANESSTALPKGKIVLTFDENILPDTAGNNITLKSGDADAVEVAATFGEKTISIEYGEDLAWERAYVLTVPIGAVKDEAGNAISAPVLVSFTSGKPLDKFPYSFIRTDDSDFEPSAWAIINGKAYNSNYTQDGDCADHTFGAYRIESADTLDLYLEQAGSVKINVTANGNRLIAISDDYTNTIDTFYYNAACNTGFEHVINAPEPVKVRVYGVSGLNPNNGSSITTRSATIYGFSISHPIENQEVELLGADDIDSASFTAYWTNIPSTAANVSGYHVHYAESIEDVQDVVNSNKVFAANTTDGFATVSGLQAKTKYFYMVDAYLIGDEVAETGDSLYSLPSVIDSVVTFGAPAIVSSIPDHTNPEAKLPLENGVIVIKFDEKIGILNSSTIMLLNQSFMMQPVAIKDSVNAADSTELLLSYDALDANSLYVIYIMANSIKGLHYNNDELGFGLYSINPSAAPALVTATYGTGTNLVDATDVPLENVVATLTYSKEVTYDNTVKLTLNDSELDASAIAVSGTDATLVTVTLPTPLDSEEDYELIIPVGAFVDENDVATEGADTIRFATETIYVEDVVFYTDFATTAEYTPTFAQFADSIIEYNLASSRLNISVSSTTPYLIDGFEFATTNSSARTFQIYGYNSNSDHGQEAGLSWGRLAMNNTPSHIYLPELTGPFKMMYSIAHGGNGSNSPFNLRIVGLREETTLVQSDSIGSDNGFPNAKLCHYEYTGTDVKNLNIFTVSNSAQIQDYEIIKSVPSKSVTDFYSHWFNPTMTDDLNPAATLDIRFNKRIKLADATKITFADGKATLDSVKAIGNSLRVFYSTVNKYTETLTVNVAIGAVKQETTDQEMTAPASYEFSIRPIYTEHALTEFSVIDSVLAFTGTDITFEIPFDSAQTVNSLVVSFKASPGAVVKVEGVVQESGVTENDFTNPVNYVVTAEDGVDSTTYIVTITKSQGSSTKPIQLHVIKMYPNPATTYITVEAENIRQIELIDLSGKVVVKKSVNSTQETLHVGDLKQGLYFVRITNANNETNTAKFIKK